MNLSLEQITDAILKLQVSPLAKETGAELVESWVERNLASDSLEEIVAVECGFVYELDERCAVIGVQDLISRTAERGTFGSEWKSTKEPSRYWTEAKWLEDISNGPQIAIYALALSEATYYENGNPVPFKINAGNPWMRVRACVKSSPIAQWPRDPEDGWFRFEKKQLENVKSGLLVKAETIRACRKLGRVPWQLTGKQCFNFNRTCQFFTECSKANVELATGSFDLSNPAAKLALPHISKEKLLDPEYVILSASSYSDASECLEKYRRRLGIAPELKESSLALDIGTVLHEGVACMYRQLQHRNVTL